MTISAVMIGPVADGRRYRELPRGVSRWTCTGTATGTATSRVLFNVDFNPQSSPSFQRYVSLDHVGLFTETAALVTLGVRILQALDQWEDAPINVSVGKFEMAVLAAATDMGGEFTTPKYLGRVVGVQLGRLQVVAQEILNTAYYFTASGFISDKPFLAPYFWRS